MYKCLDCGRILDDDELKLSRDYVSDYAGGSYENHTGCPCGGDVEEVTACEGCDDYYTSDELYEGFCENCLTQCATVDNAVAAGNDAKETVDINGFFAYLFTGEEIDKILLEKVEQMIGGSYEGAMSMCERAKDYCLDDATWFSGWLQKKGKI